jgi:hypothetical protein
LIHGLLSLERSDMVVFGFVVVLLRASPTTQCATIGACGRELLATPSRRVKRPGIGSSALQGDDALLYEPREIAWRSRQGSA